MASSARTGSAGAAYDVRTQIDFQGVAIVQETQFPFEIGDFLGRETEQRQGITPSLLR
jgi:hypothetical protein